MRTYSFATAACLMAFAVQISTAQVISNNAMTPVQLVQNILLGGGITASNITYTGYANAIGEFTATGGSNLGFSSGVYLTTGSVLMNDPLGFGTGQDGPTGPSGNFQSLMQNAPGDPDLDIMVQDLTGDPVMLTNDAAVLEFDFVPQSDSVFFRYIFASEEYNDFVSGGAGLGVNDVFGFYLTGVTTPYPQNNIALLPNGTPVSIFTVNNGYAPIGTPSSGPCTNCAYYIDNAETPTVDVTYDGLTRILTAKAGVICGETYHIKIAIADAADFAYDSGVFLEAGSFSSQGSVLLSSSSQQSGNDTLLYEGCGNAVIGLKRLGDISGQLDVAYTLTGTATNGTDYNLLPGSVTFPPNVDSVGIPISAFADAVAEGPETLIFSASLTNSCGVTSQAQITLVIGEPAPLTVDAGPDVSISCQDAGNPVLFTAVAGGGVGTIAYAWNNGTMTASASVTPGTLNNTFVVAVTDACQSAPVTDTVRILITGALPLDVEVTNDTLICKGQSVQLGATAIGGNGGIRYLWSTDETTSEITVAPTASTVFTVTVSDNCGVTASENIAVNVSIMDAAFNYDYPGTTGLVDFTNISAGNGMLSYEWEFGEGGTSTDESPSYQYEESGTFLVLLIATNGDGCVDLASGEVTVAFPSFVFIPNSFTPNNDGMNDVFFIRGQGIVAAELSIFNRWGQPMIELKKDQPMIVGWDGTFGGELVKNDVYVYKVTIRNIQGETYDLQGQINVIR